MAQRPHQSGWWCQPLAGAGAGFVAVTVCAPLDVTKTRMQLQDVICTSTRYSGLFGSLKTIYREEGLRGFFKGYSTGLLTLPCHWSIYFLVYAQSKYYVGEHLVFLKGHPWLVHMLAAVSGGVATDVATNPLWLVRTRLISQHMHKQDGLVPKYTGTFQAFRVILKDEGFWALYKGLGASLLGTSHVAVQFPLYEYLKQYGTTATDNISAEDGGKQKVDLLHTAGASAISKMTASIVTYPHEVLRARLQDQREPMVSPAATQIAARPKRSSTISASNNAMPQLAKYNSGLVDACRTVWRTEGIAGFYRGFLVNLVRVLPSTATTFVTYEYLLDRMQQLEW